MFSVPGLLGSMDVEPERPIQVGDIDLSANDLRRPNSLEVNNHVLFYKKVSSTLELFSGQLSLAWFGL